MSYEVIGWKQTNCLLMFHMVLLPIQAGTFMGKDYFCEQPMIKESNQVYRFGCPEPENGDNRNLFLILSTHCAASEQSEQTLL